MSATGEVVQAPGRFDPSRYLTKVQGKDYLEVKYRVLWFRSEFPDGTIETELVAFTPEYAVVKATVTAMTRDPHGARGPGGTSTGYGYCSKAEFGDYLEKAETKALGRALAHLGFGTQFAPEIEMVNADGTPRVVDSPVPVAAGRSYGSGYRRRA